MDVDVIAPDTLVSITTSDATVYANGTVTLTVTEENKGDVPLTSPSVVVDNGVGTLSAPPTTGDTNANGVLDVGETWSWTVTEVVVSGDTTFTALGHGIDPLNNDISFANGYTNEKATVDVDVIAPHTTLTITADVYETTPGGNVWLTIADTNDGDVNLTNCYVELYEGSILIATLDKNSIEFQGVDDPVVGEMDAGETWTWLIQLTVSSDTTYTAVGHGTDPLGMDITPANGYDTEEGSVDIEVGEATRTWGFWKTHLYLVEWMFDPDNGVDVATNPIDLGTWMGKDGNQQVLIDSEFEYMGLMWANQSRNSDGTFRTKIDQARIHTAHQALAAIMNSYMPGGAPLPSGITLESIADTLTDGTLKEIRDMGSALADYNESGDDVALDPSLPPTGRTNNADPQGARKAGASCEAFWDTPEALKGKGKDK